MPDLEVSKDFELERSLRFWPWEIMDPVPPYLREYLNIEFVRDFTAIQLEKQMRVLEVQQVALKETLNLVRNMQR